MMLAKTIATVGSSSGDTGFDLSTFCSKTASLLQFIGWAILIFKIAIPFVIIGFGMVDFGKAVVSEKDDDIKKSGKTLGRRVAAGVIIFFVPSIVVWFFSQLATFRNNESGGFENCENCLLHPGTGCETSDSQTETVS